MRCEGTTLLCDPDLYWEHTGSDWVAMQLNQKVAAVLEAEESWETIAHLRQQGPYTRFQRDVKQVQPATIEQRYSNPI